jgi:hypothetical protein
LNVIDFFVSPVNKIKNIKKYFLMQFSENVLQNRTVENRNRLAKRPHHLQRKS